MSKEIEIGACLKSIVDDDDYERVKEYKWYVLRAKGREVMYARTNIQGTKKIIYLHHFIKGTPINGMTVDHRNGNGLDNRKENLRIASMQEQRRNSRIRSNNNSGFKGVSIRKNGHYKVEIKTGDKHLYIGDFKEKIEAAKAYNEAAIKYFGDYAKVNALQGA